MRNFIGLGVIIVTVGCGGRNTGNGAIDASVVGADASMSHADASVRKIDGGGTIDAKTTPDATCGAPGDKCCAGNVCARGTCLRDGICHTCGGRGDTCCANRECIDPNPLCTGAAAGVCQTCGGDTQICCALNTCQSSGCCADTGTGTPSCVGAT